MGGGSAPPCSILKQISIRLDSQEETTSGNVARFFTYLIYI